MEKSIVTDWKNIQNQRKNKLPHYCKVLNTQIWLPLNCCKSLTTNLDFGKNQQSENLRSYKQEKYTLKTTLPLLRAQKLKLQ